MGNTSDTGCEQINLQVRKLRHNEVTLKGCPGRAGEVSFQNLWLEHSHSVSLGVSIQRSWCASLSFPWETAFPHSALVWGGAWLLVGRRVLETAEMAASGAGCWSHRARGVSE